jgi:hypothetical protein
MCTNKTLPPFLVLYNLSVDADDVLDYKKNLTYIWIDRTFSKSAEFDDNFSLVAGPSGYCHNFNMANASDLFHLDLLANLLLLSINQFELLFQTSTPLQSHTIKLSEKLAYEISQASQEIEETVSMECERVFSWLHISCG